MNNIFPIEWIKGLNEYLALSFELNIELNDFLALFNVWMNNQNLSPRAITNTLISLKNIIVASKWTNFQKIYCVERCFRHQCNPPLLISRRLFSLDDIWQRAAIGRPDININGQSKENVKKNSIYISLELFNPARKWGVGWGWGSKKVVWLFSLSFLQT